MDTSWGNVLELSWLFMKILSWNARGLGRKEKRGKVKKLLKERNIDIVLLQETKKAELTEDEVRSVWGRDKMEFMVVDAVGSAGGLLCIWDPDVFQLTECCSNRRFILLSGTIFNQFNCAILNIYAPNDVGSRGHLWDCLLKLKEEFPNPWCLGGDFNEIRQIADRRGCSRRDRGMKEFNEFIDKCEVSDLPLLGRRFTWCNSFGGEKWSKIDRIFVDPRWLEIFNLKLWGLPRLVSDHCPLLMMEDERDWGPKPFRVLNAWFLHKNFRSFWESKWKESRVDGWAGFILIQKLKILKNGLRSWNVEVFGNIVNKLKTVEGELHKIDLLAEARDLDDDEKGRRREIRAEMWSLSRMVEWLWLQKSRLNWAMKGDKNTRFFHVVTKCRTIRNELHSITEGDVVYEEPSQVKNKVMEYFKNQYTKLWPDRPELGGHFPSADGSVRFDLLETEFSEAEIKLVVMECDGNIAPGPDGFNMLCF
ncbi:uncharacterized protein LOC114323215 [Camellia sinensis]|uniref:uncharacterized protein LOC114323215 n=1 Tax=Camellia sinensis TaxID=4442 RepID=UPI001035E59C|nr:uncharacterized protein LOC114323215 [Camellia sinensis]